MIMITRRTDREEKDKREDKKQKKLGEKEIEQRKLEEKEIEQKKLEHTQIKQKEYGKYEGRNWKEEMVMRKLIGVEMSS